MEKKRIILNYHAASGPGGSMSRFKGLKNEIHYQIKGDGRYDCYRYG